jgi:hypothetical protein
MQFLASQLSRVDVKVATTQRSIEATTTSFPSCNVFLYIRNLQAYLMPLFRCEQVDYACNANSILTTIVN